MKSVLFGSERRYLQPFPFVRRECKNGLSPVFFDFLHHQPLLEASYLYPVWSKCKSYRCYVISAGTRNEVTSRGAARRKKKKIGWIHDVWGEAEQSGARYRRLQSSLSPASSTLAPTFPGKRRKPVSGRAGPLCVHLLLWGRGDERRGFWGGDKG